MEYMQVDPQGMPVVVVGDTHGQLHDVLHMLKITGAYSAQSMYIFNGVHRWLASLLSVVPLLVCCACHASPREPEDMLEHIP
jgi:hypothetical protein